MPDDSESCSNPKPTGLMTRRMVGRLAAGAALASVVGCGQQVQVGPVARRFPKGFKWGCASAAYQIEGALDADGRGPSIWDTFSGKSGTIADQSTASIGSDSYRRYREDVAILKDAGLKAYRFSIAWSRIQPEGRGAPLRAGLDYYARLVDTLLEQGIEPYATLFHWDMPQFLFDQGGWKSRETAMRFADYAGLVGVHLGDRLKNLITINEAAVHTFAGHVLGIHAPGLKDAELIGPVTHHQNLAQGLAIQALRAARSDLTIGATLVLSPVRPDGAPLAVWNRLAANGFDELMNRAYLDPLLKGTYPGTALDMVEPVLKSGDLAITQQPIDFIGVNYYHPTYMKLDLASPSWIAMGEPPASSPRDAFGRHIDPVGLGQSLALLRTEYGNPRVLITENGCSDPLSGAPAVLNDGFRIAFLRSHLEAALREIEAGSRLEGYFHWTLIDNWEWSEGYRAKFGLVAMDRATGRRQPKASYHWFKQLAETGVLDLAGQVKG